VALDQLVETYPDRLAVIRYHQYETDPYYQYNPTESLYRNAYYGGPSRPHLFTDGSSAGTNYLAWGLYIMGCMGVESNLEIRINGLYSEVTRETSLELTVTATGDVTQPNLRLFVALTESALEYQGHTHNQVMRDMIPDAEGESFTISNGQTLEFTRQFTVDGQLVDDNCEIVVFVQSYSTKEVLQAVKEGLTSLVPGGVEEDIEALPGSFFLAQNYPNPFNASTVVAFNLPRPASAALEIYNLAGESVRTITRGLLQPGKNQITWDGLDQRGSEVSSGIYFYRLRAGEWSQTRRLSLLR
jgi:hypothetical protein